MRELGKLFEQNQSRLYVLALSVTKRRDLAEDAVHDALIAVASLQKTPDNLKAYLFRVVRNKSLFIVHQQKKTKPSDFLNDDVAGDHEFQVLIQQVKKHIGQLKPIQQEILIMKLFGNLTFAEIAELIEAPLNTVSSHYRRGMEVLKMRLTPNERT